jgi:hypothetical protein
VENVVKLLFSQKDALLLILRAQGATIAELDQPGNSFLTSTIEK